MRASQQHVQPFDHGKNSILTRTLEGRIESWNRSAEDFYGWTKEDAVGRVSHELLQTQFPKPLEQIDSELVQTGKWEGKLVHATRSGDHRVVESRWILTRNGEQKTVVEINAPVEGSNMDPQSETSHSGMDVRSCQPAQDQSRTSDSCFTANPLRTFVLVLPFCVVAVWILYYLFGRLLIREIYSSDWTFIVDRLMAGRASTPVENYYDAADQFLWSGTIAVLLVSFVIWIVLRDVWGAVAAALSTIACTFFLFWLFESFPPLIRKFHLDVVSPYFAIRANFIPDDQLVFRERPFNRSFTAGVRGPHYSARYGIEVPAMTVDWKTDHNGFRNSAGIDSPDVVVIGDSYMEWGEDESKTFPGMLQQQLPGLTVMNLGKSGYGPYQYVEVLKRFGLTYKPQVALIAFYEGNDLLDIHNYRRWKAGRLTGGELTYFLQQHNLLGRYLLALRTTATHLSQAGLARLQSTLDQSPLLGKRDKIHPDLAVLELGQGRVEKMLIGDAFTRLDAAISEQENWTALATILREIKDLCADHEITPIFVYIPSSSHIYAQFSTAASGEKWSAIREWEIAAKEKIEQQVTRLVESAGIDFVSLSGILEQEATDEKPLYFPFDPHWTREGTTIAAEYIGEYLKRRHVGSSE